MNGVARNLLARLRADGTLDTGFLDGLAGASGWVNAVAVQSDGKVGVGGTFTHVNGVTRNVMARLNADGTVDTEFLQGLSGINGAGNVKTVAVQSDGKLLIGGTFTNVIGVARNSLARLHADGTLDTGFLNGLDGANERVYSLAVQRDGKVVIGGEFSSVNGVARNHMARLQADGTLDRAFLEGLSGPDGVVHSLAVQSDGKIVIAGNFSSVNGVARYAVGLARLNADGTLDTGFLEGLSGPNGQVDSLAVQSDGKVLIGGDFHSVNGEPRVGIARLNADGTLAPGFPAALFVYTSAEVHAIAMQSDGKIVIGGSFGGIDPMVWYSLARLNADLTLDRAFLDGLPRGLQGDVHSLAVQPDGKVVIGGRLSKVNGVARSHIARLKAVGRLDAEFLNPEFLNGQAGASGIISTLALSSDGKVVVGGFFTSVNGVARHNLARLNADGTLDTEFLEGQAGPNSPVQALTIQNDGKILLGGEFGGVNGSL